MLYNFEWLKQNEVFPPAEERPRLLRYKQNASLFNGNHFADPIYRPDNCEGEEQPVDIFLQCARRISKVIGNFDDVVSFPTLLNYQRLMSLKMSDLVCGERPTVSGGDKEANEKIKAARDYSAFDEKLYATAIDISRFGDALWRVYKDEEGKYTFTCWTPTQWFPIVAQDGTNSIKYHCLCWVENRSEEKYNPDWVLHVQKHGTAKAERGYYIYEVWQLGQDGSTIQKLISQVKVLTGLDVCAVIHLKPYTVTNTVYGYDDYMNIDSIMAEIIVRVGQISAILDKHADPNITGPVSMLQQDPNTGEWKLGTGNFFAISPGEDKPSYMTWDGQLEAAFKQLEFLINQLYILSEMGAALLGGADINSGTAISGAAMRFKMVNPLSKARRTANAMTLPVRILFSCLCDGLDKKDISVFWADGLPDDPRENIENAKLASGEVKLMPLEVAIMEYFGRSNEEALDWIEKLKQAAEENMEMQATATQDPNHPGPQNGTGVNPQRKGSTTGLNNYHSTHPSSTEKKKGE